MSGMETAEEINTRIFYIFNKVTFIVFFDVLLTVHLSIFISVFNQLDAQNLFHNKFYFMPLHVSSTCVHHQEVTRRPPICVMILEAL